MARRARDRESRRTAADEDARDCRSSNMLQTVQVKSGGGKAWFTRITTSQAVMFGEYDQRSFAGAHVAKISFRRD
jgi:hypothetical protein